MQPSPRNQDSRIKSSEHLGSWFLVPGGGLHLTQIFKCSFECYQDSRIKGSEHLGSWFLVPGGGLH